MKERKFQLKYLLFIAPAIAIWVTFTLIPNIDIFRLQFFDWNGVSTDMEYVGLENLKRFMNDPYSSGAIINTIIYVLFLTLAQSVFALGIAMALKENTRLNRAFRTCILSPIVVASVAIAIIWGYMFDPNLGVINTLLRSIGLNSLAINWLGTPILAVCCVAFVHMWHNMGYAVLLFLAGLQTIPNDLYEASAVGGANKRQIFRRITLPLIMPVMLRILLLTIATSAIAFDYAYALGGTMAFSEFDTLSVYMFRQISMSQNFGIGSLVGSMIASVVFLVFIIQFLTTKRIENSRLG